MKNNRIIVCVMAILMAVSFAFNTAVAAVSGSSAEALYQEGLRHDKRNTSSIPSISRARSKKAFECFLRAAQQGHAKAQAEVGYRYWHGNGVEENYEEGIKWCLKAAEQGGAAEQNKLAWMYDYGKFISLSEHTETREVNYVEAAKWYRKAAEQGDVWSQKRLAEMYRKGEGVNKSSYDAIRWYRKVVNNPNSSKYQKEEAEKWLKELEEKGSTLSTAGTASKSSKTTG